MYKRIRVYDMDGTIVCSLHRYRTINVEGIEKIDLPYWRENSIPDKIMQDSLLPLHKQYKQDLNDPECYVIVATARQATAADFKFIEEKMGKPNHFIYRKGNDTRRGADMKLAGLKKLFSLKQFRNITDRVFFEDNKDYLTICPKLGMIGVLVESKQGH